MKYFRSRPLARRGEGAKTTPLPGVRVFACPFLALALLVALAPAALALDPTKPITQFGHDIWKEDLPQNTVHTIVQTHDGYIWLGTYEGLVRFNGVAFEVYDKRNTPELKGKGVRALFEDLNGTLWIGTLGGGVSSYRDGTFANLAAAEGVVNNFVYAFAQDPDGTLWIGTDAGLAQVRDGRCAAVTLPGLPSSKIRSLTRTRDGTLWVGTGGGGLCRLKGEAFETVALPGGADQNAVYTILEDRSGTLWVGTIGGLIRFSGSGTTTFTKRDGLSSNNVWSLCEDRDGNLWIGTDGGGLNRLTGGVFTSYTAREGLSQDFVRSLFEDREGSLWVGTNGGLNRFKEGKFTTYTTQQGLPNNNVRVVYEDHLGGIWVGTDGGGVTRFKDGKATVYSTAQGLSNDFIRSLWEDSQGAMWIGTNGGGVNRLSGTTFTVFTINQGLGSNVIRSINGDRDGNVWIGTEGGGLSRFSNGQIRTFTTLDGLSNNDVRTIFEDRDGALWVGTYGGGLSRYRDGQFTSYGLKDGLGSEVVLSIYQDADGTIWLGSNGGGLTRLSEGRFSTVTTGDGLFDDNAFQILEDGNGYLWMTCNKGIFRASKQELNDFCEGRTRTVTCTNYGKADGMGSNQCNGASQPAGWRARDGRLWFPTVGGVAVIDPNNIRVNDMPPPVTIHSVRVDNRLLDLNHSGTLPRDSEKFEFHYDGLSFLVPERVRFKFRLEGLDREWIDAGMRRVAYYNTLPPGRYTFHVIACNNDGVWNETGASFTFELPVPPWRTWWAYTLYVISILGAVYAASLFRVRTLHSRNRFLQARIDDRTAELAEKIKQLEASERSALEANKAKSVFLANMSHELRTPLNAILGFVQLMQRKPARDPEDREYLDIVTRSGEHLLGLINDVLSISKIEAGRLTLNERIFDVRRLLLGLEEMFRVRAQSKDIELVFDIDDSMSRYVAGDEGKLRQVLINLLGNAVKFTESGRITLRVRRLDASCSFEVSDTGYGMDEAEIERLFEPFVQTASGRKSSEGTGLGLAISRNFIRLMGGDLTVESAPGRGSSFRFEVSLPAVEGNTPSTEDRKVIGLEPGQTRLHALVVDDMAENRTLLTRLLAPIGFEVREATNGAEAVDIWSEWRPQVILMDIRMPVMDGYEATRSIRALHFAQRTGETPVIIALTASAFEHDRQTILEAGCDDYVSKPFRDVTLFEKLTEHLGVRFVYEQDASVSPEQERERSSAEAVALAIAALPPEIVERLKDAASRGSSGAASRAAELIRERDQMLADTLAGMIWTFSFDDILDLIEAAHAVRSGDA